MDRANRVSRLLAGAAVAFGCAWHAAGVGPAATMSAPLSGFRGGVSFSGGARIAPSMGGGFGRGGFGTTGASGFPSAPFNSPGRSFNQWNVQNGTVPGTLPALNSNTMPAMNSGTLPALNSNTLPLLNTGAQGFSNGWTGGVPGVPPGSVPNPPTPPSVPTPPQPCPVPPVACPPGWNWWPWGWNSWVAWNGANFVVYWNGFPVPPYVPGPFGGLTYLYDPNLLPGATQRSMADQTHYAPAPAPTAFDYGVMAFRDRQSDAAMKYLTQAIAKDKEDTAAMRVLSLAMLDMRQADDATAMIRQAYRLDPTLANSELDVNALGLTAARRSTLINRAVEYANRVGSGSSWLMVSVLMQADGRYELARRMLKRGADVGLEPGIYKAMDAALAGRIRMPRQNP
ncbi:MAG: tetratricopeptide repeat protein [Phycisphaerales bacterium]